MIVQGGPKSQLFLVGLVITPLFFLGEKTSVIQVSHLFWAIYSGPHFTPFITIGSGPKFLVYNSLVPDVRK